jgi:hypothetical protein
MRPKEAGISQFNHFVTVLLFNIAYIIELKKKKKKKNLKKKKKKKKNHPKKKKKKVWYFLVNILLDY